MVADSLETALARAGLDPSHPSREGEMRTSGPHTQTAGHAIATRAVITDASLIHLVLSDDERPVATLLIDPASGVALIASLAAAIARRSGMS